MLVFSPVARNWPLSRPVSELVPVCVAAAAWPLEALLSSAVPALVTFNPDQVPLSTVRTDVADAVVVISEDFPAPSETKVSIVGAVKNPQGELPLLP